MCTHILREAVQVREDGLGAVSRSYMDLGAAALQAGLEGKRPNPALIQLESVTQPCCCSNCLVFGLSLGQLEP